MEKPIKVAVVRGSRRRGAVAEALALIATELSQSIRLDREPVILADVANVRKAWSCTHRDTLSATVDAVLASGASSVRVVGGPAFSATRNADAFARLGYQKELWGRPANFPACDPNSPSWNPIRWLDESSEAVVLRAQADFAASRCRISIAVPKTHPSFRVGLGMANLTGALHRDDRLQIDPRELPAVLAKTRGLVLGPWLALRSISGGMRLTSRERAQLDAVERRARRLVALTAFMKPTISLIDGFSAMHREGPYHGRRTALGTVIAGTDPVAVDAVAASIMGFNPLEIACLREAHRLGLGTAELSEIMLVGDTPIASPRKLRRHSTDPLLRLTGLSRVGQTTVPRPHFPARTTPLSEKADANRI